MPVFSASSAHRTARLGALMALTLLGAAACNSDVDDIDVPDLDPPERGPVGVYTGRTTFQSSPDAVDTTALVDSTGRIVLLADDRSFLVSGLYETAGRGITSAVRFHLPPGLDAPPELEPGEEPPDTTRIGDLVGSFGPSSDLTATYLREDGEAGAVNLTWRAQTRLGSRLERLEGTWAEPDTFGDNLTRLTFDEQGMFSGVDRDDCLYTNGEVSIIDFDNNLYRVEFSRNCPNQQRPESFVGLATRLETEVGGRVTLELVIGAANTVRAVLLRMIPAP